MPCDTTRLALAVSSVAGGSLLSWAILREGSSLDWVRRDLATLLDPYRVSANAAALASPTARNAVSSAAARRNRSPRLPRRQG